MFKLRPKQIIWIIIALALVTGFLWLLSLNIDTISVRMGLEEEENSTMPIEPAAGNVQVPESASNKVVSWQIVRPIEDSDYIWPQMEEGKDLIVYMDLSQEYSPDYYETIKMVAREFDGKLKIAMRPFFARSSLMGYEAAVWTECAAQLGGKEAYYSAIDYLLSGINSFNSIKQDFSDLAETASLDLPAFEACVAGDEVKNLVEQKVQEAGTFGVAGTPSTFVGVKMLPGAYPMDDFVDSSERARDGLRTVINEVLEPVEE